MFEGENQAGTEQTARVRSTSTLDGDRSINTTWFGRDGEWKPERELVFRTRP